MNEGKNFIETIIDNHLADGRFSAVITRFPPEPNGYLHIGHAKSICLNFRLAEKYGGRCNLRFDDTNPCKEDQEFVDAIMADVRWLGFDWQERLYYASDYFDQIYQCAERLIEKGLAYVCDLSAEEIRRYRGTLTEPGKDSPYRNRAIEENLRLFRQMRDGAFADGSRVLRARIDMASPNLNLRDPVLYRIVRATHHRTGDRWCIYPMYDYAHPISDAIEGITHSVCTLEFEDHRPLYEWILQSLEWPNPPQQIEFARLNLTRTIMSKRYLRYLVEERIVDGWDDPRMPTLSGIRRRGVRPAAIRAFCEEIGVAKANSVVDIGQFEHFVREDLSQDSQRVMVVLDPVRLIIDNWPEDKFEELVVENHPQRPEMGSRKLLFGRELFIERGDFMSNPPPGYNRLTPNQEVRLRGAYIISFKSAEYDGQGNITAIRCNYDPATKSGTGCKKKVRGVIHWVEVSSAVPVEVAEFSPLLDDNFDARTDDIAAGINRNSRTIYPDCRAEQSLAGASVDKRYQFLRHGYYCLDSQAGAQGRLRFNCVVGLKDSWSR
ncbi:MAG: glutamine--tRNA ligase/YqeY domain fusion protein [Negativicutes bacterium]|nr:glutamine--tRNA ligase/YqeY domain fusion protein [Negativicutes bacterium]